MSFAIAKNNLKNVLICELDGSNWDQVYTLESWCNVLSFACRCDSFSDRCDDLLIVTLELHAK